MTSTRVSTHTQIGVVSLYVSDCANCGVVFGMTEDLEGRRRGDAGRFYCPNGHTMSFGESDKDRLRAATAKQQHLADQLQAAERDAEQTRAALVRDRGRIANGVCPCCNRSFDNVRRHMASQHPDYGPLPKPTAKPFKCSCSRSFESYRGLRIHQGYNRPDNWTDPNKTKWSRHLTVASVQS